MFRCSECGSIFSEPESRTYCYEDYCGVASMFEDRHSGYYDVCPYCGSEELTSYWEEEDDDRVAYYEKQGDEYVYYDSNECELYREPA